jgi:hypothetical protein
MVPEGQKGVLATKVSRNPLFCCCIISADQIGLVGISLCLAGASASAPWRFILTIAVDLTSAVRDGQQVANCLKVARDFQES